MNTVFNSITLFFSALKRVESVLHELVGKFGVYSKELISIHGANESILEVKHGLNECLYASVLHCP